jgi:hypothetical protein
VNPAGPKVEVSIQTKGKVFGNDYQGRTTYWSKMQASGFLYGEGQGMARERKSSIRVEAQAIAARCIS